MSGVYRYNSLMFDAMKDVLDLVKQVLMSARNGSFAGVACSTHP